MTIWSLPGPAAYVASVGAAVRAGSSAVLRLAGKVPPGLDRAIRDALDGSRGWTTVRAEPDRPALEVLAERFAAELLPMGASVHGLCSAEDFQGRVVWVDDLTAEDWPQWHTFLAAYAHASRDLPPPRRTLLVVPVCSGHRDGDPPFDVTLGTHDWGNAVDETDALFHAERILRRRDTAPRLRSLLARTAACVALWDLDLVEKMLELDDHVVLEPHECLREYARERGWDSSTPLHWTLGTADPTGRHTRPSRRSPTHPARSHAASGPPRPRSCYRISSRSAIR